MFCDRILGTTHHGTYKKVVNVLFEEHELRGHSFRRVATDGVELEIEVDEDLCEGDIIAETEHYVYAVKIYVPKKKVNVEF
ncbi:MAG: hypothetical protein HUK20_10890 [Fibrobacter sp.]|nr:hypothetical protein [Fibrobacter sp.]